MSEDRAYLLRVLGRIQNNDLPVPLRLQLLYDEIHERQDLLSLAADPHLDPEVREAASLKGAELARTG